MQNPFFNKRYNDYASALKKLSNERVQKILVNAGFTCPNRDGTKGTGGCTYCNNQSFSPDYCQSTKSVSRQISEGIDFFKHKYPAQKYLIYFQAYTNTYAGLDELKKIYEEALQVSGVIGLVIGTRPDCVSPELLDYFAELSKCTFLTIEYGVESVHDDTLLFINRGHSYSQAVWAIEETAKRGVNAGAHLILGLPHESREMIMETAKEISKLPINTLKLHQLQLIKGTVMAKQYEENPALFSFFAVEDYVELLVDFLELLNPAIAIERFVSQSPKELLMMPDWGLKNFEFTAKIEKRLRERDTWQGKYAIKNIYL